MKKPVKSKIHIVKSHNETLYLLKSPANAKRLLDSLEKYEKGLDQEKRLIDKK